MAEERLELYEYIYRTQRLSEKQKWRWIKCSEAGTNDIFLDHGRKK
jgi:hypothetical protein